ncbi:ABC transporter ATP-binding protein [Bosea sp. 2YAB26]|uniref:ABC transporter ATP-binding protein n=1 Tax=Bosea sp. 2YAB26 TaxID=3237478 RepID=UPI003F8F3E7B
MIQASNLSKAYRTYSEPVDRLKQSLSNRLHRVMARLGRPTPARQFYTEHWALRPFNLEVRRGETVAIIGRNGSGKSTLLSVLCGTVAATTGTVRLSGRIGALLELGSGFNPEFTGRENVYLNASLLGLSNAEIEARLDDIAAFAEIGEYFERPIKTYSSGMSMRLAFSVIAHVDCDVLIVDEALAVGDAYFQQKCLRWLRQFQRNGTVLFVSHDTGAVLSLCSRAIWLNDGVTLMDGSAKDVCEAYRTFIHKMATGQSGGAPHPAREIGAGPPADAGEIAPPAGGDGAAAAELPPAPDARQSVFDLISTSASFGTGLATLLGGELTLRSGRPLPIIVGGEDVTLAITAHAHAELDRVIMGFIVKDRLGQPIFGDNSLERSGSTVDLRDDEAVTASFMFRMPLLAAGRYSITLALATGSIAEHIQHHWIHDALMFDVSSPVGGVMFNLPPGDAAMTFRKGAGGVPRPAHAGAAGEAE